MLVNNGLDSAIRTLGRTVKCLGTRSYIMIGQQTISGHKDIYLIKREGERSWGAYALTDVAMNKTHIKGNSSSIMKNVHAFISYNTEYYSIDTHYKATLRKAIMEAMCYGTLKKVNFEINKT